MQGSLVVYNQIMKETNTDISEESSQEDLQMSFNNRISRLCCVAALVIAVVAFATIVLGAEDPTYVLLGLCLSVALLAIAGMQNHTKMKR